MPILSNINTIPAKIKKKAATPAPPVTFRLLLEGVSGEFILTSSGPTNYIIQE